MISTTHHIRGEQLRQLREAQGISVSNLARRVHLSNAQILQLEYGDVLPDKRSMFYSSAIEEIAAMKVANALGADPQSLWNNTLVPELQTATPESKASTTYENIDSFENIDKNVTLSHAAPIVKTGNNTLITLLGSAIVLLICGAFFYSQVDIPFNSLASGALSLTTQKEVTQKPPLPASSSPESERTLQATEPVKSLPEVVQTIGTPTQARLEETAFAGCDRQKTAITLATDQPLKAGISVYVEALEEVSLCIEDGTGAQYTTTLKANEHKTFRGSPPWSVHASDTTKMKLFFQGQKLHWPEVKDAFFILKETAGIF